MEFFPSFFVCVKVWQNNFVLAWCNERYMYIPYSGKLSKEKTFANFAVLWLYTKVFFVKFGSWHPFVRQKQAIRESFLPQKFPAVRYIKNNSTIVVMSWWCNLAWQNHPNRGSEYIVAAQSSEYRIGVLMYSVVLQTVRGRRWLLLLSAFICWVCSTDNGQWRVSKRVLCLVVTTDNCWTMSYLWTRPAIWLSFFKSAYERGLE